LNQRLTEKLGRLPKEPGCYLMKDAKGVIIYVGKATSLRNRVGHYFGAPGRADFKTRALVEDIYDFDVIITATPVEALLLERTLIKHHNPRYNINLRDDKEYPYLRIDMKEEWPRLDKVRRRKDDGAVYLGPFGSAGQLRVMLGATYRIFPLIRCSRHEFKNAKRPCNYYGMKMCLGPCTLPVPNVEYKAMVGDAIDFLAGRNRELVRSLKQKMESAAEHENYELAALVRDQLIAFESVTEKQAVVVGDVVSADVFGHASEAERAAFAVITVREGKMIGSDSFVVRTPVQTPQEALREFLILYYDGRSLPDEILLPFELGEGEDSDMRGALLTNHPESQGIAIKVPARGARQSLAQTAGKNATFQLEENDKQDQRRRSELEALKDKLKLTRLPVRMECIDISNIQGTAIVASNVCFVDGKPAKEFYRHYIVETVQNGPDDFASMREVVGRRLRRGIESGDLPDLLVIDGGKGQLSAALDAAAAYPSLPMDLVSLAKSKVDKSKRKNFIARDAPERSYERVFFPDRELAEPLSPGTPEYRLLCQIRDEAHRFAITHHRKRRAKLAHGSDLEDVPGIGPTMRKKLLETFGGLEGLKRASLEDLLKIKGLRDAAAVALHARLRASDEEVILSEAKDLPS